MKVSELTGWDLDFWVARAEGHEPYYSPGHHEYTRWLKQGEYGSVSECPCYSTDWTIGGPIIARECIGMDARDKSGDPMDEWCASAIDSMGDECARISIGPTPLVAAMRAYVASRFGAEVPDEEAA